MFHLNLGEKSKGQRSSSVKMFQPDNPRSASTTSRRNISHRSAYTQKNHSTVGGEVTGACCSGHGVRMRNPSIFNSKGFLISMDNLSTVIMKNNHKKDSVKTKNLTNKTFKGKLSSSTNLSIPNKSKAAKLENYTKNAIDNTVNKIKKQKSTKNAANKTKSSKKIIKEASNKKSCYDEVVEVPLEEQKINMIQVNPFADNKLRRRSKIVSVQEDKYEQSSFEQNRNSSFLKKQSNSKRKLQKSFRANDVSQNLKQTNFDKSLKEIPKNPQQDEHQVSISEYKSLLEQLSLKKQIEKHQQQTITQLKQNNSKLQNELIDSYKKYQTAVETQYSSMREVQNNKMQQILKIQAELKENKTKMGEMERECLKLKAEKEILVEKYNSELSVSLKERSSEREELLKKIYAIEEKCSALQNACANLERQNKELKQNSLKFISQKQKYESAIKKYQKQINQLQNKLENEVKKNKQNEKQLSSLKKQKTYIKENSEAVLQIVRKQLKQCQNQISKNNEIKESSSNYIVLDHFENKRNLLDKLGKNMDMLQRMSPMKHKILGQYNL